MCIYDSCIFKCLTKYEHNSKYAKMRRSKTDEKLYTRSFKVNWYNVEKTETKIKRVARVPFIYNKDKFTSNI